MICRLFKTKKLFYAIKKTSFSIVKNDNIKNVFFWIYSTSEIQAMFKLKKKTIFKVKKSNKQSSKCIINLKYVKNEY